MKIYLLLATIGASVIACNPSAPDKSQVREMFNADSLQVITSFANSKLQTMSVLYGNSPARQSALLGYRTHSPGEIFKLVTYKQADNKFWYGSHINGAIKSVEIVAASQSVNATAPLTYTLERGQAPTDSVGDEVKSVNRINYIFSHKPSVFP